MTIPEYHGSLPLLTTEQMIEVDRLMIEKYEIRLIQMMENAGRGLAILAKTKFLNNKSKVAVLAGTGGNGGGALVCARRLISWGYKVDVFVSNPNNMKDISGHQLAILKKMNVLVHGAGDLCADRYDLIIDGIIGYSLQGKPSGVVADMIRWSNEQETPVLSLDTPSGIDLTSGDIHDPVVRADATLTLALPKKGLYEKQVKPLRGMLYLADISVPPELYGQPTLGLEVVATIFQQGDIIRID